MILQKSRKNYQLLFIIISILFFLAMFLMENINGRFWLNDFKVYYLAAQNLLDGKDVYGISFGLSSGYYKYSPFTLLLFTPFCILPYSVASVIQYIFISAASVFSIIIIVKLFEEYALVKRFKNKALMMIFALLCIGNHLVRELHMGNTNMMLLFLMILSLYLMSKSKFFLSGLVLALVVLCKPYFVLLLLPLFIYRKFRIIYSFIISFIIFVIIPAIFIGFTKDYVLHKEWILAMLEHNSYLNSTNTILSIFQKFIYDGIPAYFSFVIIILIIAGYCIYVLQNIKLDNKTGDPDFIKDQSLVVHFFVLLAIIPNLLITDTEHFLLSLPLIILLIFYLGKIKKWWAILLFVILMIIYGGNSTDLLGKELSKTYEAFGFLGISNLLLIGVVMWVFSSYNYASRVTGDE